MTELSFLIDLLINQKLSRTVKTLIVERIKALEATPATNNRSAAPIRRDMPSLPPQTAAIPVEQIAQTPEAAAAIASRNEALNAALSGKIPKGQERPRKW